MKKKSIIILILFVVFITFIAGFSNSYISRRIEHLAYVLVLGIDKGEKARLKISIQFINVSSSSSGASSDSSQIVLTSCEANSMFSGLNLLNSYIGKEINLAHCSVVVFSEEIAKEGISSEIYSLINNEEIRSSANIVVTNCKAYDYINNSKPNLENLTSKYFDTFDITSKLTGYFSNITLGNFFNNLSERNSDPIAVLGGLNSTARSEEDEASSNSSEEDESSSNSSEENESSSNSSEESSSSSNSSNSDNINGETSNSNSSSQDIEDQEKQEIETNQNNLVAGKSSIVGGRGTENLGIAIFSGDKYIGELTVWESICHSLIINSIDTCIISVEDPLVKSKQLEIQLSPNKKSKITSNIENGAININIELNLIANIISLNSNINYEDTDTINKISTATQNRLNDELNKYFDKTARKYNVDIDKYYLSILKYFPYQKNFDDFNYKEKLKNANFNCNTHVNIISSLLITKT